jgi:hypothetical protein
VRTNGSGGVARGVLDRCAREPGRTGERDRLGDACGIVGEAVLEIGRDRNVDGLGDRARVGERERAVDGVWSVAQAEREREARARRRERIEAERCEDARASGIPGVGDDERERARVERPEAFGFFEERRHRGCVCRFGSFVPVRGRVFRLSNVYDRKMIGVFRF